MQSNRLVARQTQRRQWTLRQGGSLWKQKIQSSQNQTKSRLFPQEVEGLCARQAVGPAALQPNRPAPKLVLAHARYRRLRLGAPLVKTKLMKTARRRSRFS